MKRLLDSPDKYRRENGAVIIYVALALFLMLAIAALAIDVGYNRVVRSQLQNAADAAALAACNKFYPRDEVPNLSLPPCDPAALPRWAMAAAEGANAVTINSADNNALQTGTIIYGWWDIGQAYIPDQWSTPPVSPPPCTPPGTSWGPAVRVTITKVSGQNSGAMPTLFGKILGVSTIDVDATATAVAASPGQTRSDAVMPYTVSRDLADQFDLFDTPGTPIVLGDPYHCDASGCYEGGNTTSAGQFTTFTDRLQDVTSIRGIVAAGNPTMLSVGTPIWLQSGVERTVYDSPSQNQVSLMSEYTGKTVGLPVVEGSIPGNVGAFAPIAGYIGFHVICAGKGCTTCPNALAPSEPCPPYPGLTTTNSEKIVIGYFTQAPVYGTGPVGSHYGPLDRCRLAR